MEWHLRTQGSRLTVTADLRAPRWYLTFVVALGSLLAVAYTLSLRFSDSRSLLPIGTFFGALALSSLLLLWLGAFGGGRQVAAVWQPVLERVEKAGGTLEPLGRTVSRRYTLALAVFLALHLVAFGPQWTVGDVDAHAFARVFYEALECGETFGQAMLASRRAVSSPLGRLAFKVYAHPNGRLRLGS